jgi:hypothetical protein
MQVEMSFRCSPVRAVVVDLRVSGRGESAHGPALAATEIMF